MTQDIYDFIIAMKLVNITPCSYIKGCLNIGLDKSGYQVNIFRITPRKHVLWVLIRSPEALLMSSHNIWFHGEIRKISILLD